MQLLSVLFCVSSGIGCAMWWWNNVDHQARWTRFNIWRQPCGLSGCYRCTSGRCWTALHLSFPCLSLTAYHFLLVSLVKLIYTERTSTVMWNCLFLFAGDWGGEAGRECWTNGRSSAGWAEKTPQRCCDHSQRKRPTQRNCHQRDPRYKTILFHSSSY